MSVRQRGCLLVGGPRDGELHIYEGQAYLRFPRVTGEYADHITVDYDVYERAKWVEADGREEWRYRYVEPQR